MSEIISFAEYLIVYLLRKHCNTNNNNKKGSVIMYSELMPYLSGYDCGGDGGIGGSGITRYSVF
jgi:hypothetical protein